MFVASQNNNVKTLQWLYDHGAKEDVRNTKQRWYHTHVDCKSREPQWKHCSGCLIMVPKRMFEQPDNDGVTPMLVASQENHVEALQWLFDHGAKEDVRTPDNDGVTPMYFASQNNHVKTLQWLYDHGAQEDVRTPQR